MSDGTLEMAPEQIEALGWTKVESSNVRRIAWHGGGFVNREGFSQGHPSVEELGDLYIDFGLTGAVQVYRYADVPERVYVALLNAASVGSMVHKLVRGKYHSDKVLPRLIDVEATVEGDIDLFLQSLAGLEERLSRRLENIERGLSALARIITATTTHKEESNAANPDSG